MFYQPKHFALEELVPPDVAARGAVGIMVMDSRILWTLDALREKFGVPITVNNWKSGGQFSQRGFRDDPGTGAPLSQHRYGRAADFDVQGVTAAQFRAMAKNGDLQNELQYITGIEETNAGQPISWVHIDCGNRDTANGIVFIQT